MRIDVAAHILPARPFARLQQVPGFSMAGRVTGIPCLFDLDVRSRVMDAFDEYQQDLSLAAPPVDRLGPPEAAPDPARLAGDARAALPDRPSSRSASPAARARTPTRSRAG